MMNTTLLLLLHHHHFTKLRIGGIIVHEHGCTIVSHGSEWLLSISHAHVLRHGRHHAGKVANVVVATAEAAAAVVEASHGSRCGQQISGLQECLLACCSCCKGILGAHLRLRERWHCQLLLLLVVALVRIFSKGRNDDLGQLLTWVLVELLLFAMVLVAVALALSPGWLLLLLDDIESWFEKFTLTGKPLTLLIALIGITKGIVQKARHGLAVMPWRLSTTSRSKLLESLGPVGLGVNRDNSCWQRVA